MEGRMKTIIFTDLDGTLLDRNTYSYQKALPLVKKLKRKETPIIFCTAKTRAENEYYQKKLKISDPFIVENGGAIFIPKDYFSFSFNYQKNKYKYKVIELGESYTRLRSALRKIRKETGFKIKGFGDMTTKEVAKDSGLPIKLAKLAKMKEYNESFNFYEEPKKERILTQKIKKADLRLTHGGRYYDIIGKNADKGKAVRILTKLLKKKFGRIKTIGLGDSLNDVSMLKVVDVPILVQKPTGNWDRRIKSKKIIKIKGVGPQGWIMAVKKFVTYK